MKISEVAAAAGCSVSAIRHLHETGAVPEPARTSGNYRDYSAADLAAVHRARALIDAGVAVADIHRPDAVERSISLLDDRFASDVALGDGELALGGPAGTDVLLDLREPVDAAHDTYPWQKARTEPVTRVRFYAGQTALDPVISAGVRERSAHPRRAAFPVTRT